MVTTVATESYLVSSYYNSKPVTQKTT